MPCDTRLCLAYAMLTMHISTSHIAQCAHSQNVQKNQLRPVLELSVLMVLKLGADCQNGSVEMIRRAA